jgi:uncharacterized protein (DUF2267 family)
MTVEAIERSMHHAHAWLTDVAKELGSDDRRLAYRVLRAYLHLLRDRLTVEEAAHLAAQLPHFWRGVFFEGWVPARVPQRWRDRETFLRRLADDAQLAGTTDASFAAAAVTAALRRHVAAGEMDDVLRALPEAVRPLLAPQGADNG